jgi:hypothetical protein
MQTVRAPHPVATTHAAVFAHPQTFSPASTAMHVGPGAHRLVQSLHAPPVLPHAPLEVPMAHVVPSQQPA